MRRTAREAEQTRLRILESAIACFVEHGYENTSAEQIAGRAGVTRGALHHHFGDKRGAFREAFVSVTRALDASVREQASRATTPRAAVLIGARASLAHMARPDYFRIAIMDAPVVLGEGEWHAIDGDVGMKTFRGGLKAMHAAGEIAVIPEPLAAVAIFGALTELARTLARERRLHEAAYDEAMVVFTRVLDALAPPRSH